MLNNRIVRLLLLILGIGACLWTVRAAGAFGLSRFFVRYSMITGNLVVAQAAAGIAPRDAQAHRTAGAIHLLLSSPAEAQRELERAVALRPTDYSLWLALGQVRDQTGDVQGALAAFDEAVRRAPFYAQPHWQRGNLLLRSGQFEPAFADLNFAAQSNPEFVPNLIDLAWSLSKGDAKLTEELAQINSPKMHLAFARLLARQGKASEAVAQFRSAGPISEDVRRELIEQLMYNGAMREAFEIWHEGKSGWDAQSIIFDGGFEGTLSLDEIGFGWKISAAQKTVALSQDASEPHSGSRSLRIDFNGNSDPATAPISQMIIVEPSSRYQLNFAARSDQIVTGGLPLVIVTDASREHKRLGQSQPISKAANNWQLFSFEFTTPPASNAVILGLYREGCTSSPCPIFGSVGLDSFSLQRLK